jgi:GGDEF domain-containing protein
LLGVFFSVIKDGRSHEVGRDLEAVMEQERFFELTGMRLVLEAVDDPTLKAWGRVLLLATDRVGVNLAAIVGPRGEPHLRVRDRKVEVGDCVALPLDLTARPQDGFAISPTSSVGWDAAVPLWHGDELQGWLLLDDTRQARDFVAEDIVLVSMHAQVHARILALRTHLRASVPTAPLAVEPVTVVAAALQAPVVAAVSARGQTPLPLPGLGMINRAMQEMAARGEPWACLMVGLSGLRAINLASGRAHGNALLLSASDALRALVPRDMLLGRYAGDVFLVAGTWGQMEAFLPAAVEAHLRLAQIAAVAAIHWVDRRDIELAGDMHRELAEASLTGALHAMFRAKRERVGMDSERRAPGV